MKHFNFSTFFIILLTSSCIKPTNTTTSTTLTTKTMTTTSTATTKSSKDSALITLTKETLETTNIVQNQNTIKTSTTTNSVTITLPVKKIYKFKHVINLLGPLKKIDIVFLMARTIGIGKRSFYQQARQLTMALLKQYASVHPEYARVAYVTFASNSSVDYDDITNNSTLSLDKCQLFPSTEQQNFILDKVMYKNKEETLANGTTVAIPSVNAIFQAGRKNRPNVEQILFWVTDADFEEVPELDSSVIIFGVGLEGDFYKELNLLGLVKDSDNMGTKTEWFNLTKTFPQSLNYSSPLHVDDVNETTCSSLKSALLYDKNSTDCFCDVDYGLIRIKCKLGYVDVFEREAGTKRTCKSLTSFKDSCITNTCQKDEKCKIESKVCTTNELDCTKDCKGICIITSQFPFCKCPPGLYGPSCSFKENNCRFANICMNKGQCKDMNETKLFQCKCTNGYGGDTCERKVTINPTQEVLNSPFSITAAVIASGIVGGIILLVIVVGVVTCSAIHITRKKVQGKPYQSKKSEMGTSTEASGSVSKWSVKNKNNLSVRLSKLWKQRSFKENDGMPTVPWRTSTQLTGMELQSVDPEETIIENEIIHDNRPVMENWKIYLNELIENGHLTMGLMVNVFAKEIITTEDWEFNWSEVYTLDSVFGTETNVNIQNKDYFLKSPENGVACAKSGLEYTNDVKNLLAFAKTKKYLIAGIVALSDSQDGSECIKEVELIMNHVKSEGY